jgi:hypothetical protein
MKVVDAFLLAGIKIPGITIVTDSIFKTTCPTCKESQTLNQCKTTNSEDITYYKCKNGCEQDVVIVYSNGAIKKPSGNAYRLKDYVIKSYSDLFIVMLNGAVVQLPK